MVVFGYKKGVLTTYFGVWNSSTRLLNAEKTYKSAFANTYITSQLTVYILFFF